MMGKPPEMRQKTILIGFCHKEQGTNLLAAVGNSYPLLPNQWTFGNISMVSMSVVSKLGVNGSAEKSIGQHSKDHINCATADQLDLIHPDLSFSHHYQGHKFQNPAIGGENLVFIRSNGRKKHFGVLKGICIGNYFGFGFQCLF